MVIAGGFISNYPGRGLLRDPVPLALHRRLHRSPAIRDAGSCVIVHNMRTLLLTLAFALAATAQAPEPTSRAAPPQVVRKRIQTIAGQSIEGQVLNEGMTDL